MTTPRITLLIAVSAIMAAVCSCNGNSQARQSELTDSINVLRAENAQLRRQQSLGNDSLVAFRMLTEIDMVMAQVSEHASDAQHHIDAAVMALHQIEGNDEQIAAIEHQLKKAGIDIEEIHIALGEE